jgi:hypothetical protein
MKKVRVGAGSAFWGDMLEPAVELVEKGDIQYIGFDHLAELTMAILQRMRAKDPSRGYIPDIVPWMRAILPACRERGVKVITNAGGANPEAGADEVVKVAQELGLTGLKIAVILGDDLSGRIDGLRSKGWKFKNLDTGEEDIDRIKDKIVGAYAYIGADSMVDALGQGADVIVAGRVSDNAMYVAPFMHEFGWDFKDPYWDRIGSAITVGHVIECSGCCCGGCSNVWKDAPRLWEIGFPIAEMDESGDAVITKAPGSGGLVNQWTVKEHLVYEIHDPRNYLMPDGIADFTTLNLEEIGKDQVRITGMSGKPRPDTLKVGLGYEDGFIGEGIIFFSWPDAYEKAKRAEEIIRERFKAINLDAEELRIDYVGSNILHGSVAPEPECELNESGLRVAAKTRTRSEAYKIRREVTHLWVLAGVGSHMAVPTDPRPVISYWPTLLPREEVPTRMIIKEVK